MHLLSESTRIFSLPTKVSGAAARFGRQVAALQAQLEHVPSLQEISDELDISEEDAQAMMVLQAGDVSLSDRAWFHGGAELADTLPDRTRRPMDDDLTRAALVEALESAMEELEPKERRVMRLRYGLVDDDPWMMQQIGRLLRLSRERVRQIESRAMQKLRRRKNLRSYLN
jgi:DNA-directed RNA polymerase sigma subunit (sigma70/sigma32)